MHPFASFPPVHRIRIIDSHTAGEPTRVVLAGGPDLGDGPLAERRELFAQRFDHVRSAIVNEPRGSDPLVGALLTGPDRSDSAAGVIFFNTVGTLGMCGHGTIGLVATLAHLGRIGPGDHRIDTPVGAVTVRLLPSGEVSVENVPSYRFRRDVPLVVPGWGEVRGDVAWGGNWFFLVRTPAVPLDPAHVDGLTAYTLAIRGALTAAGVTGAHGAAIDHVELFGPPGAPGADSRNFVLCPGGAYDRSPCGTGTSAKVACLAADGLLAEGALWRQEGIAGGLFTASYRTEGGHIIPTITGRAYITGEADLLLDPEDPFCWGIRRTE
jgi:4-hydroxyproline epimerase